VVRNHGPTRHPKDIVVQLNAELNKALADAGVRKRLLDLGAEPAAGTPEQLGQFVRAELDKWAKVIRDAGVKLE